MSANFRFPNITAKTEAEQIAQLKSYLHQLVQQLNYELSNVEVTGSETTSGQAPAVNEAELDELKAMLARATAKLNEYWEKVEGHYVSQSDFDAYAETVAQVFENLGETYVSQEDLDTLEQAKQTAFEEYQSEVSERFENLGETFVPQTDFGAYKQATAETLAGFDNKYVLKTDFDAYAEETAKSLTSLQQKIDELQQTIDSMQETGGE